MINQSPSAAAEIFTTVKLTSRDAAAPHSDGVAAGKNTGPTIDFAKAMCEALSGKGNTNAPATSPQPAVESKAGQAKAPVPAEPATSPQETQKSAPILIATSAGLANVAPEHADDAAPGQAPQQSDAPNPGDFKARPAQKAHVPAKKPLIPQPLTQQPVATAGRSVPAKASVTPAPDSQQEKSSSSDASSHEKQDPQNQPQSSSATQNVSVPLLVIPIVVAPQPILTPIDILPAGGNAMPEPDNSVPLTAVTVGQGPQAQAFGRVGEPSDPAPRPQPGPTPRSGPATSPVPTALTPIFPVPAPHPDVQPTPTPAPHAEVHKEPSAPAGQVPLTVSRSEAQSAPATAPPDPGKPELAQAAASNPPEPASKANSSPAEVSPQPSDHPSQALPKPSLRTSGIAVAPRNQSMKFAAEQNEIAGSEVQKLPTATGHGAVSPDSAGNDGKNPAPRLVTAKAEPALPASAVNFSAKPVLADLQQPVSAPDRTQSADRLAQIEHTANMVNREVVMMKQSGAESLAVSLKVDQHTELFLQLSNHDGQLQASLRFERGDASGLSANWGQLQESLARHNVQLLPLENRNAARDQNLPPQPASTASGDSSQRQTPQNPDRQAPELRQEAVLNRPFTPKSPAARKSPKQSASPRDGFESWA